MRDESIAFKTLTQTDRPARAPDARRSPRTSIPGKSALEPIPRSDDLDDVRGKTLSDDAASPVPATEVDSGSVWDAISSVPRLLGTAVRRGVVPAGLATVSTLRREGPTDLHWKACGDALVRFAEGAGPLLTKLGQILATREDLLPAALCRRLERLYAQQTPMSRRQLKRMLRRAHSKDSPFESFDWQPLAVGSIGQVHRARLRDSSPVVVKLLRPGIEVALKRDLRSARGLLKIFFRLAGQAAREGEVAAKRALDALASAFEREVDFEHEADTLEEFARRFEGNPRVCIPHCYREFSSAQMLVLEELRGVPLSALRDDRDAQRANARRAAEIALTEILSQIFREGYFHADPHAGNLLMLEDGRLGLIDLGLTGRLEDDERRTIARAVRALVARDVDGTLRLLLALGELSPDFDLDAFRDDIRAVLIDQAHGVLAQATGSNSEENGQVNRLECLVADLFRVTRRHGVWLPESTTLLIKTLVTIEGVARSLDPEINVVVKALPIIAKSLIPKWLGWGRRFGPR